MMTLLPVEYGSFFTRLEKADARYKFNKPRLRLYVLALFVFSASILGSVILANFYLDFIKPAKNFNNEQFTKTKAVADSVQKSIALIREARPEEIEVCSIIQKLLDKPSGISLLSIDIQPEHYVVKGVATDMSLPHEYLSRLEFPRMEKAISDIKSDEVAVSFTITVDAVKKTREKGGRK